MPKPFLGINEQWNALQPKVCLRMEKTSSMTRIPKLQISQNALYFIGGLLKHASCTISNPVPNFNNSYKRLVKGYEAPCYIAYGFKNRSTLLRITASCGLGTRIECRSDDPSCNPYLAFAEYCLKQDWTVWTTRLILENRLKKTYLHFQKTKSTQKGIGNLPTSLWEAYHFFRRRRSN